RPANQYQRRQQRNQKESHGADACCVRFVTSHGRRVNRLRSFVGMLLAHRCAAPFRGGTAPTPRVLRNPMKKNIHTPPMPATAAKSMPIGQRAVRSNEGTTIHI